VTLIPLTQILLHFFLILLILTYEESVPPEVCASAATQGQAHVQCDHQERVTIFIIGLLMLSWAMHIPDGYLSPQTFIPLWGIMLPVWAKASRVLKTTLRTRHVPLFAMSAAFSFVIMMFNVPTPGGTTGHATGAALVSILLGPWAAVLAVSAALIIQALLFGDGGITTIGANCFNMGVVIPFVGFLIYRLLTRGMMPMSRRRAAAGAVAAYVGANISALVTAIELGIQPWISRNTMGKPLYCPFPLNVTVPAMVGSHLFLFGLVEALLTSGVILYLQKSDPSLLTLMDPAVKTRQPVPNPTG
jgi:cobalt/nickel transport system permease protein